MRGVLFYGAPLTDLFNDYIRSYLKNTSNAQLRCCGPPQNAHILPCMLRFLVGPRLVLERNLHF